MLTKPAKGKPTVLGKPAPLAPIAEASKPTPLKILAPKAAAVPSGPSGAAAPAGKLATPIPLPVKQPKLAFNTTAKDFVPSSGPAVGPIPIGSSSAAASAPVTLPRPTTAPAQVAKAAAPAKVSVLEGESK